MAVVSFGMMIDIHVVCTNQISSRSTGQYRGHGSTHSGLLDYVSIIKVLPNCIDTIYAALGVLTVSYFSSVVVLQVERKRLSCEIVRNWFDSERASPVSVVLRYAVVAPFFGKNASTT